MKTETKSQVVQIIMRPSTYEGLETIAKGMLVSTNEAINVILEGYIHPIAPKGGPAQNARVEDASDTEAMRAAELLKSYCRGRKCKKCTFIVNGDCQIHNDFPIYWELPHRKTRKEVLLEKFPNADTQAITDIMCPRSFGISDRGVTCPSDYDDFDCEACWNAPAESEEE